MRKPKFSIGEKVWFTLNKNTVSKVEVLAIKKTLFSYKYMFEYGFDGIWALEKTLDKIEPPNKGEQ